MSGNIARQIALPLCRSVAEYGVTLPDGFGGAPVVEPEEFVEGGTFDSSDGWTLGAGWSIAAGVAANSGAVGNLSRPMVQAVIPGNSYRARFDFTDAPAEVFIQLTGASAQSVSGITTTPFDETFVATSANTTIVVRNPDGEEFSIDNLSLSPVP